MNTRTTLKLNSAVLLVAIGLTPMLTSCSGDQAKVTALQSRVDSLMTIVNAHNAERAQVAAHLARFDSLDYLYYTGQKWDQFHISHADNIEVTYSDGRKVNDLKVHTKDLEPMFVFAPDTRITQHEIMFGSGEWTCVTGAIDGTFTQPMPIGNGKFIQPTGKPFHLLMCTVGKWKDGKMIAENLFWDNQALMNQIGLGQ